VIINVLGCDTTQSCSCVSRFQWSLTTGVADSSSSCNVRSLTHADGCSLSADDANLKVFCFCFFFYRVIVIDLLNENVMKRSCLILNYLHYIVLTGRRQPDSSSSQVG